MQALLAQAAERNQRYLGIVAAKESKILDCHEPRRLAANPLHTNISTERFRLDAASNVSVV